MNDQLATLVAQLKERRAFTFQERIKSLDIRDEIWRKCKICFSFEIIGNILFFFFQTLNLIKVHRSMPSLLNVRAYVRICVVNENDLHGNINDYINPMNSIQILDPYV
jgi:hypothetical protein